MFEQFKGGPRVSTAWRQVTATGDRQRTI